MSALPKGPQFMFGDIVVVHNNLVGVIVKTWEKSSQSNEYNYEVYVRTLNGVGVYNERHIRRMIVHKELSDDDLQYYK